MGHIDGREDRTWSFDMKTTIEIIAYDYDRSLVAKLRVKSAVYWIDCALNTYVRWRVWERLVVVE